MNRLTREKAEDRQQQRRDDDKRTDGAAERQEGLAGPATDE